MIAPQKQKRVSTQKSTKKSIPESEPTPTPAPDEPKKMSYRQRLIEKIGIEEVRNRERASRLATRQKKALAQSIPVS
jgi:hypothetical protein